MLTCLFNVMIPSCRLQQNCRPGKGIHRRHLIADHPWRPAEGHPDHPEVFLYQSFCSQQQPVDYAGIPAQYGADQKTGVDICSLQGWNDLQGAPGWSVLLRNHRFLFRGNFNIERNDPIFEGEQIPIIAITNIGNNTTARLADCVLRICTREKLYSKIATFSTDSAIVYLLDFCSIPASLRSITIINLVPRDQHFQDDRSVDPQRWISSRKRTTFRW